MCVPAQSMPGLIVFKATSGIFSTEQTQSLLKRFAGAIATEAAFAFLISGVRGQTDFKVSRAGSSTGTLYGKGLISRASRLWQSGSRVVVAFARTLFRRVDHQG